ncbi:MAG: hypothetical protein KBT03_03230 [Bacteroidales bacterium]|nr:hypothetical protein [Candidatus Scybalousia scybalohippi]
MDLKKLINDVKKDGKLNVDELHEILVDAIEDEWSVEDTYRCVYKKAYGEKLNKSLAECWVKEMSVTDESERESGEKWTFEQTTDVGNKLGIDWNKLNKYDWYAVLNAAYSDFYDTAKSYGHESDPIFFASLARSFWIRDNDVKGKTPFSYYFRYVA